MHIRAWRLGCGECVVSNPVTPTMHPIHERYLINGRREILALTKKDSDHI